MEASGPTPSTGSLLAIGACPVDDPAEGFYAELRPLPDRPWSVEAERIHGLRRDDLDREGLEPRDAMASFEAWVGRVCAGRRPVFLAFNATFDWMFVADYFHRYLGRNPFGISGLDLKAYFMGRQSIERWGATTKADVRQRFAVDLPHTHRALEDAREQAEMWRRVSAAEPAMIG